MSDDPDNPTFRQILLNTRRSDHPDRYAFEFAVDASPSFPFDPDDLAGRAAIVARVLAATGQAVAVTDFLGTGELTNDRATALLDQTGRGRGAHDARDRRFRWRDPDHVETPPGRRAPR